MLRIHFDDKEYTLDLDEMDTQEAKIIKRQTGMGLMELQRGLSEVDPDALTAVYWLMMKQSGKVTDMDRLNFKIVKFGNAVADAILAENAEAEADEAPKESPTG